MTASRAGGQSALLAILDGLIDRMLKSPLMRRAPVQCGPEEQAAQASLLIDVVNVRALRSAAESLPTLSSEAMAEHWPEMAALLSPVRRSPALKPRQATAMHPAPTLGGLYDTLAPEGDVDGDRVDHDVILDAQAAELGGLDRGRSGLAEDLTQLLKGALLAQGKPMNTTQMLTWLHQHGATATRENVMNALFAREDLFRKRGAGQWILVGREPQPQ